MQDLKETSSKAIDALTHVADNLALSENQKTEKIAGAQLKSLTTVSIITIVAVVTVVIIVAFVTVSLLKKDSPKGIEQGSTQSSTDGGDNVSNNNITF